MKKALIAALASLMLAGALCAVDGAPLVSASGTIILGDTCLPATVNPPTSLVAGSDGSTNVNEF